MKSVKVISGLAIVLFITVAFRIFICFFPYPELDVFCSLPKSSRIYDCNGELIQILSLDNGLRREFISLEEMPPDVVELFLQAEDKNFFRHSGVDFLSMCRAIFQNIKNGRIVSGASTVTMQLARMIKPLPKRNILAKCSEVIDSLRLEARLTKNEILELYLNHLPFGFNTEGVMSAARFFFGTELSHLSRAQISCLAVIPRKPALYNPLENPEKCITAVMKFSNQPYEELKGAAYGAKKYVYPENMQHYVRYLISRKDVGCYIKEEIKIAASLELHRRAEYLLNVLLEENQESRITNAATLICDNKTGEILTWVGSVNFYDDFNGGQNDGVLAKNQPGSSMKPFLYAMALESGFTVATVLPDIPMEFGNEQLYVPLNFNNRYNGPVRLRTALASSLNVPAVYLLNQLGLNNYLSLLNDLEFTSLENSNAGLGLALGNAEVSLFELVQAFSVFPRDGIFIPLVFTADTKTDKKNIFQRDTARLICNILSDADARYLGFGSGRVFKTVFPSMFKTGTANQFQNITALAATPLYTVGVWMGNFNGDTVVGKTGSSLPAYVAKELLTILQGDEVVEFEQPILCDKKRICILSGLLATDNCPDTKFEFLSDNENEEECSWHNKEGVSYPEEFSRWFYQKKLVGNVSNDNIPLQILTPRSGSVFFYDSSLPNHIQNLTVEVVGGKDDLLYVRTEDESFTVSRPFSFKIPLLPGEHKIEVLCGDEECEVFFRCKK